MLRLDTPAPGPDLTDSEPVEASTPAVRHSSWLRAAWRAAWPRLAALVFVLAAWQFVVWLEWRPAYVLPGPLPVFQRLFIMFKLKPFDGAESGWNNEAEPPCHGSNGPALEEQGG